MKTSRSLVIHSVLLVLISTQNIGCATDPVEEPSRIKIQKINPDTVISPEHPNSKENTGFTDGDTDSRLGDDLIVMLLNGTNSDGEKIFVYLKISEVGLALMKDAILNREEFSIEDFGEPLAAGKGEPSPELREEMNQKYSIPATPKSPKP